MMKLWEIAGVSPSFSSDDREGVLTRLVAAAMRMLRGRVSLSPAEYLAMDDLTREAWDMAAEMIQEEQANALGLLMAKAVGNADAALDLVRASATDDEMKDVRRARRAHQIAMAVAEHPVPGAIQFHKGGE